MRVAALYDIHGNLPALEAVLEEVRRENVDAIVIGGDVFPGPLSIETLHHLLALNEPVHCLRGNCDRMVLDLAEGRKTDPISESHRPAFDWVAKQLGPGDRRVLAAWPLTMRLRVEGIGEVLFCHATPFNDTDIFTRLTPDDRIRSFFENARAQLVVCGHTHMQFDRTVGDVRVVNAGSVGMPFGEPGAYWLLFDSGVQLRRTEYDLAAAAERIRATAYPEAEQFATTNVLQPPTEEAMLELFSSYDKG